MSSNSTPRSRLASEQWVLDLIGGEPGGSPAPAAVLEKLYLELKALKDAKELVPGQLYRLMDYRTCYLQPRSEIVKRADFEPLLLKACGTDSFLPVAFSEKHPNDVIYYEFDNSTIVHFGTTEPIGGTNSSRPGWIKRRCLPIRNIDVNWDWRSILWLRTSGGKGNGEFLSSEQNVGATAERYTFHIPYGDWGAPDDSVSTFTPENDYLLPRDVIISCGYDFVYSYFNREDATEENPMHSYQHSIILKANSNGNTIRKCDNVEIGVQAKDNILIEGANLKLGFDCHNNRIAESQLVSLNNKSANNTIEEVEGVKIDHGNQNTVIRGLRANIGFSKSNFVLDFSNVEIGPHSNTNVAVNCKDIFIRHGNNNNIQSCTALDLTQSSYNNITNSSSVELKNYANGNTVQTVTDAVLDQGAFNNHVLTSEVIHLQKNASDNNIFHSRDVKIGVNNKSHRVAEANTITIGESSDYCEIFDAYQVICGVKTKDCRVTRSNNVELQFETGNCNISNCSYIRIGPKGRNCLVSHASNIHIDENSAALRIFNCSSINIGKDCGYERAYMPFREWWYPNQVLNSEHITFAATNGDNYIQHCQDITLRPWVSEICLNDGFRSHQWDDGEWVSTSNPVETPSETWCCFRNVTFEAGVSKLTHNQNANWAETGDFSPISKAIWENHNIKKTISLSSGNSIWCYYRDGADMVATLLKAGGN